MKTPPSHPDPQWNDLLEKAKADVAPPIDLATLLSVVRKAPGAPRGNWTDEFRAIFAYRAIPSCFAAAAAFALIAGWQAWESWQDLPWAVLLDTTIGGAS